MSNTEVHQSCLDSSTPKHNHCLHDVAAAAAAAADDDDDDDDGEDFFASQQSQTLTNVTESSLVCVRVHELLNALEVSHFMRYTNLRLTYLLTYETVLPYPVFAAKSKPTFTKQLFGLLSAPSHPSPATQIWPVNRRRCALYKFIYLLI